MEKQKNNKRMTDSEFALATMIIFGSDIGGFILFVLLLLGMANFFFVFLFQLTNIIGSRWVAEHYDYTSELKRRTGKPNL